MGSLAPGNVRLTNSIRDRIMTKVLNYKFKKNNFDEVQHDLASLAQAVYNSVFSEKMLKQMADLPAGWLPKSDYIRVQFGYETPYLYFSGQLYGVPYEITRRLDTPAPVQKTLPSNCVGTILTKFDHSHDLTERYTNITTRMNKLKEEYTDSKNMLRGTLAKFHTTNRLIEAWPEVKPFVIEIVGKPASTSTALSVPIATLNEKFGLPVPDKA